jgi:hypothetical protein
VRRIKVGAVCLYLAAALATCIYLGIPLVPDRLIAIFLPLVLLLRRLRAFIRDWLPFLVILFSYEFLRGLAGAMAARANLTAMLNFDGGVFGAVPSEWLQQRFFDAGRLHWWDYAATLVYFLHFVAPMVFGLALWLTREDRFRRFAAGLLALSAFGLATYVVFPAAPPWMAAQRGLLHVQQVLQFTLHAFPDRVQLPTVYAMFDSDEVAAVPSLHAGYSLLIALFAVRFFGRRAIPGLLYPIAMSASVVYMGEHYVGDVLLGGLYALAAFAVTEWAFARFASTSFRRWTPAWARALTG